MTLAERVKETLHRLLSSAKIWAAVAGGIAAILAKRGIFLPPEAYDAIKDITMTLLGAMGAQDLGKALAAGKTSMTMTGTGDVVVAASSNSPHPLE